MRRKGSAHLPLLLPLVFVYGGFGCVSLSLLVMVVSLKCFMWRMFLRHDPPLSRVKMKDWLVPSSEILACSMMPVSIHCFFLPVVSCRVTPGLHFSELFFPGLLARLFVVLSSSMLLHFTSLSMLFGSKLFGFLLRKPSAALPVFSV